MESMMESLLSKEVLYPPLKELSAKYPDWLADNRSKLSEEDFSKFNQQFQVTQKICQVFEKADAVEGDGKMSKEAFDKVVKIIWNPYVTLHSIYSLRS